MVQKPPYWRAHRALGHLKQSNLIKIVFVLDVSVDNLLSRMAVFVPCDRQLFVLYNKDIKVVLRPKKNSFFPLDFKTMLTKH